MKDLIKLKLTGGCIILLFASSVFADLNDRAIKTVLPQYMYRDVSIIKQISKPWPTKYFENDEDLLSQWYPKPNPDTFHISPNAELSFTFVGLGDSYGAGQGAPNNADRDHDDFLTIPWLRELSGSDKLPLWENSQCRRSRLSAFYQSYDKLKSTYGQDIHINFKSYACSAAKTSAFFEARVGKESIGVQYDMGIIKPTIPAQFNQLEGDYDGQDDAIDAVVMSIGGNNVGFGDAIIVSLLGDITKANQDTFLSNVSDSPYVHRACVKVFDAAAAIGIAACEVAAGEILKDRKEKFNNQKGNLDLNNPNGLFEQYKKINNRLEDYSFIKQNRDGGKNILIMEYPNALKKSKGESNENYCTQEELTDIDKAFGISIFDGSILNIGGFTDDEIIWLGENIYDPLISIINKTHQDLGWIVVPVVYDGNKARGMCRPDRAVNLNIDALKRQGSDMAFPFPLSGGIVHPNKDGYVYMARELVKKLKPILKDKFKFTLTEKPTNLTADIKTNIMPDILSVYWDDNSNKESKYSVRLGLGHTWKEFNTTEDSNKIDIDINSLQNIIRDRKITIIVQAVNRFYFIVSDPIEIAFKKPKINNFSYYKGDFEYQGNEPGNIKLTYDDIDDRGMYQIMAWVEIDLNVTEQDLNKYLNDKNTTFTQYNSNSNVQVDDEVLHGYYAITKNTETFDLVGKYIAASVKVCNNMGCSKWSTPIIAKPIGTILPTTPNPVVRQPIPDPGIRMRSRTIETGRTIRTNKIHGE